MELLAPGDVVGGCRIEGVVGRGGMGVVYLARQLELERDVALKVISPDLTEDPLARGRFLAEARAAAAVEHPNVVPVHAVGTEHDRAYLVMRFIHGDDLRTLVRRDGPLAPLRAAAIAEQLGDALDAIHRAGYVHRDVKPANVLIDDDGHVYLSDFGLAKAALATRGPTTESHWVGTLDYVAPEQIRGGPVDGRTDIYALGGVLHFMLTGLPPFGREGDEAKLWAHLHDPPPRPSDVTGVPPGFDAVVARAMAKDPLERHASAGELGRAARAIARGEDVDAPTVTAGPMRGPIRRRARAPLLAAALIAPAGASAIVGAMAFSDRTPREAAPAVSASPASSPTPAPTPADPPARRRDVPFQIGDRLDRVGFQPTGIAVADGGVWVVSRSRERIVWLDPATSDRRHAEGIGTGAASIATDGASVWVALERQSAVARLDARTGELVDRLSLDGQPTDVAVGRTGLWIGVRGPLAGTATLEHHAKNGELLNSYPVSQGIADLTYGGGSVWVALEHRKRILRAVPGEVSTHAWLPAQPQVLAYGRGKLWATVGADAVARIDPETKEPVTVSAERRTGQLDLSGHHLVVAGPTSNEVLIFDVRRWGRDLEPERMPVGLNPFAVEARGKHVWVTGLAGKWLTRLDR